jgi:hypothetical protein
MIDQKQGSFLIIRVDGSEELIGQRPSIAKIHKAIGCECLDMVTLDRKREIVMVVDDTGMVDGKPVNAKATALAREAKGQPYPYSIHGDVAIVNDRDFA